MKMSKLQKQGGYETSSREDISYPHSLSVPRLAQRG